MGFPPGSRHAAGIDPFAPTAACSCRSRCPSTVAGQAGACADQRAQGRHPTGAAQASAQSLAGMNERAASNASPCGSTRLSHRKGSENFSGDGPQAAGRFKWKCSLPPFWKCSLTPFWLAKPALRGLSRLAQFCVLFETEMNLETIGCSIPSSLRVGVLKYPRSTSVTTSLLISNH